MRLPLTPLLSLLLVSPVVASSSFRKDVVQGGARKANLARKQKDVNDELLSVAIPLDEYQRNLARQGLSLGGSNEENQQQRKLEDFEVDYDDMYSFSGYSLRYAKCQPVQYFSENAVLDGQYSPMVTEDVVILRLCPESTCSESSTYGCYYNYAEYALTLNEYVKIMLMYTSKKREYVCEWCEDCVNNNNNNNNGRRLEDGEDNEGEEEEDEGQEDEEENNNEQQQYNDDGYYSCSGYNDYCYTYNCEGENDGGDDSYMDYDEYLDYIDCAEVNYNDYAYFVRPRCDGDSGTFKMEVYYDNYCVQYAGSDVSVKDLGLGFKEGMFEDYYTTTCIDCSESYDPPYFDASSTLCNKVHSISAKCTDDLMYDLFENDDDESGECNFIESIRFGAYDEDGNFASSNSFGSQSSWDAAMTIAQKVFLGLSIGICVIFVIYACYLHHSMTNLLIKSLSHRELLPPSRSTSRKSPMKGGRRVGNASSSKRFSNKADDEPDWDAGSPEAP